MKKYFIVVCKVLPYLIYCYFSWILPYSRHPQKYDIELRFLKVQKLIRKVLKAFKVNINETNFDDFYDSSKGKNARFIVCNHLSDLDPLVFIAIAKKPITFVSKKENEKLIFIGRIIRILGGEFIDRDDLKQELKVFLNVKNKMVKEPNVDWVIFPEGTRNKTNIENVHEFKNGTFKFAMKVNAPIYVFSMFGSQRVLDIKCKNKLYPIQLKLNKVLDSEEYLNLSTVEVATYCHKVCADGLNEIISIDDDMTNKLNN